MIIESQLTLDVPIKKIWEKLLDTDCLQRCIPGCESVIARSDQEFEGIVTVKIGPIKTRFKVELTIVEKKAPTLLISKALGKDLFKAGRFIQKNRLDLKEFNSDKTMLTYASELNLSGRIATFGERVFRAKAKEMEEEFLKSLKAALKEEERKHERP